MPVPMKSMRDYTLRTRSGHTISFPANKVIQVPDEVVSEALAVNLIPVSREDVDNEGLQSASLSKKAVITGSLRDAIVLNAIAKLAHENEHANFNAGGQPKVNVLSARTGMTLSGHEVSKYWQRYRESISNNEELPSHPRMDDVLQLQDLSARGDLMDLADAYRVDRKILEKKSIREMKEILMHAVINYNEAADLPPPILGATKDTSSLVED